MQRKLLVVLSVIMVLGLGLSGIVSANLDESNPIKVAVAASMTGENAEYGQGFVHACQLMADQWNA
ncbi:MAG: hypothetical protein ACOYD6_09325 [Limnochordia bacterium]|jgi:ABC-type branched-subunit amino acid transport system substrate-binding protein